MCFAQIQVIVRCPIYVHQREDPCVREGSPFKGDDHQLEHLRIIICHNL